MKQQLLLLENVYGLGVKGAIVSAKPGYVRNYLLPKKLAVLVTQNKGMLRKKEKLEQEQKARAALDEKVAREFASQVEAEVFEITVKVDPIGRMYGSVTAHDLIKLFADKGLTIERNEIILNKPIKEVGLHKIALHLKHVVKTTFDLKIIPEGGLKAAGAEQIIQPISPEDAQAVEQGE